MNTAKIAANYFAPKYYVQADQQSCLLHDRQGERLIALPDHFLLALDETMRAETGKASALALYTCGSLWGEGFYRRFAQQMQLVHGTEIAGISLAVSLLAMREFWAVHGFGLLGLDFSQRSRGLIVATLAHSVVAESTLKANRPTCHLEAGILVGWFREFTGQPLACVQTECLSLGAEHNTFVLFDDRQLQSARELVKLGHSHPEILEHLKGR